VSFMRCEKPFCGILDLILRCIAGLGEGVHVILGVSESSPLGYKSVVKRLNERVVHPRDMFGLGAGRDIQEASWVTD
jgi:hypothetical protein